MKPPSHCHPMVAGLRTSPMRAAAGRCMSDPFPVSMRPSGRCPPRAAPRLSGRATGGSCSSSPAIAAWLPGSCARLRTSSSERKQSCSASARASTSRRSRTTRRTTSRATAASSPAARRGAAAHRSGERAPGALASGPKVRETLRAALADRYRLEREIGRGGMATVYLAEDLRHRRKVAVKVLRPELAATIGPDRFLREIEIAAQLQHPHILPLLDSGQVETGEGRASRDADDPNASTPSTLSTPATFLYYVMPFVQGETLRERLTREHELPVHDAVRIVAEVADALSHAHAHGVVHRDIKPENILLSGRHALVADFGVAKAVTEASGALSLTSVGVALGTPTYMAPEQASADPALDHRVDIYALGVVAYELLAGHPPFTGRTAQEVLAAHMTRTPESIRTYRGSVPAALDATILRCLEKHPADRWQSTGDLDRKSTSLNSSH